MPGVLGAFSGKPLAASTAKPVDRLLESLCAEPNYKYVSCVADEYANAGVFAPICSQLTVSHGTANVAVYGEVFLDAGPADATFGQQLANCTPETIESVLKGFDGSWCGFVWWKHLRRGALFVDHCGSKPIYYATQDEVLWFTPEPKSLAPKLKLTLDQASLAAYMTVGHVLGNHSYYREVRSLPPGTLLHYGSGGAQIDRYYEYSLADSDAVDEGESVYAERLHEAMKIAMKRRLPRLAEAVIPISGGWDSRGILAYAHSFNVPLKTVSWGTNEDDPEADAALGRRVAAQFGTTHRFLQRRPECLPSTIEEMVDRVDALTTDPAAHYQEVEFMQRIRDEVGAKYLLRGDEVFGFMWPADTEHQALGRIGIQPLSDYPDLLAVLREDARPEFVAAVDSSISDVSARCSLRDYTARKDYHYFYERLFNYLHKATYYKQTVLDVSNPWLDKSITAVNSTVPLRYRADKQLYKTAISRYLPVLEVPFAVRSSLESWPVVFVANRKVSEFINDHLRQRNSPIYDFLAPDRVAGIMDALTVGHSAQTGSVRLLEVAKKVLRAVSPSLYSRVRKQATGKVQMAAISPVDIIFRALVLKIWFDRHAPGKV